MRWASTPLSFAQRGRPLSCPHPPQAGTVPWLQMGRVGWTPPPPPVSLRKAGARQLTGRG